MRLFFETLWIALALSALLTSGLRAEWRKEIFLGKASTSNSDLNIEHSSTQNHLLFQDIKYSDKSFRPPLYYGLRAGYFPGCHRNFGFEAEFIHAKIYSKAEQIVYVSGIRKGEPMDSTIRLGEIVQGFSMSHGLNFLFFNLVSRFGLFKNKNNQLDKIGLYGRLGIGASIPHTESVIDRERKEQYELHGPAYQLAAGTRINIWEKMDLLSEYKYTYVKIKDAKIAHGHAKTEARTKHLIFGIGEEF
jgi:hypothetical protein